MKREHTTPSALIAQTAAGKMTIFQLRLLAAVAAHYRGCANITDLIDALPLSPGGLTRCADGLVDAGYLKRREHHEDSRRKMLIITKSGVETLRRIATALHNSARPGRDLGNIGRSARP